MSQTWTPFAALKSLLENVHVRQAELLPIPVAIVVLRLDYRSEGHIQMLLAQGLKKHGVISFNNIFGLFLKTKEVTSTSNE